MLPNIHCCESWRGLPCLLEFREWTSFITAPRNQTAASWRPCYCSFPSAGVCRWNDYAVAISYQQSFCCLNRRFLTCPESLFSSDHLPLVRGCFFSDWYLARENYGSQLRCKIDVCARLRDFSSGRKRFFADRRRIRFSVALKTSRYLWTWRWNASLSFEAVLVAQNISCFSERQEENVQWRDRDIFLSWGQNTNTTAGRYQRLEQCLPLRCCSAMH